MSILDGVFQADDRARIALGKAGVKAGDRFLVKVNEDQEILLIPVALISKKIAEIGIVSAPMPDMGGAFA